MLEGPLLIAKPLFLDSPCGIMGLSGERMRDVGNELSPFRCGHREEGSQQLCDARGVGLCGFVPLVLSLHDRLALLVRRWNMTSDRFPPETAIGEA
jgi:hypothetical protein